MLFCRHSQPLKVAFPSSIQESTDPDFVDCLLGDTGLSLRYCHHLLGVTVNSQSTACHPSSGMAALEKSTVFEKLDNRQLLISLQDSQLFSASDGLTSSVSAELSIDSAGIPLDRAYRERQFTCDFLI